MSLAEQRSKRPERPTSCRSGLCRSRFAATTATIYPGSRCIAQVPRAPSRQSVRIRLATWNHLFCSYQQAAMPTHQCMRVKGSTAYLCVPLRASVCLCVSLPSCLITPLRISSPLGELPWPGEIQMLQLPPPSLSRLTSSNGPINHDAFTVHIMIDCRLQVYWSPKINGTHSICSRQGSC